MAMSTQIDERIVSMRFDNSQFEKNVSTTLTSLSRLKQALRLDGASKGLETVTYVAKNTNVDNLGKSVDSVKNKFISLKNDGTSALDNISKSAANSGKQMDSVVANTTSSSTSMFDKLKRALRLDGASKGLEEVGAAAKKVDMTGLGKAVESVHMKFSALQVAGVTALANITNSAVNAGKRMISALTIDPVKTGFSEYETQINSTQTIFSNTKHKGSTLDDVNKALEELNRYADLTIYNFTEMTRNIGTFTAAGVDLETSVNAIQGIANLAAVSGSTSQQASTAMYQLSQALSTGTVRLMDWNSVVNAGMGGQLFQNALRETSELLGTGAEAAIKAEGSFRNSLNTGWLTSEVLTETLKKFTTSGANEYIAKYTGLAQEQIAAEVERAKATGDSATAMDRAAESISKLSGKSKDEIKSVLEFAQDAEDAATKVKTFTQLWSVMKEAAQSGWAATWKIIIGDFEQARSLLTPLSNMLTDFINGMSDARNKLLKSALGRGFSAVFNNVSNVSKTLDKVVEPVQKITGALEDLDVIASKVIRGDFGNGQERFNKLTEAGENFYRVQNKVNEVLGDGFRYTQEQIDAQDKLLGVKSESTVTTGEETKATVKLTEANKDLLKELVHLSETELRARGYNTEQIKALKELGIKAEKLGIPLDEFIDKIDQINGRWLLINSFKNIGKSLISVFTAMKDAWVAVFPPKTFEEQVEGLFNLIAGFHKFTSELLLNDATAGKLERTFKGVFAVVDVITTILGGGLKIAFKVLTQVLKYFDLDILDVTAAIGDSLVAFRDWFDSLFDISGVLDTVGPLVEKVATATSEWFKSFKESTGIKDTISYIKDLIANVTDWWSGLKDAENLPRTLAEGIVNAFSNIPKVIGEVFSNIWSAFKDSFGEFDGKSVRDFAGNVIGGLSDGLSIASQTIVEIGKILLEKFNESSLVRSFKEIAGHIIGGFVNGLTDGVSKIWNAAVEMAKTLVEKVCNFLGIESPSKVFYAIGGFIVAGLIAGLQNGIPDSLGAVKDLFQPMLDWIKGIDFGSLFAAALSVGTIATIFKGFKVFDNFNSVLGKFASPFSKLGDIFGNVADIIADSAKSINKVIKGVGKVMTGVSWDLKAQALQKMAIAIAILAAAVIALALIPDHNKLLNAVIMVGLLAGILVILAVAMDKLSGASININAKSKKLDVKGLQTAIIQIGLALLSMAIAVKLIGELDPEQAKQGFIGLAGMAVGMIVFLAAMGGISRYANDASDLGKSMLRIGVAIGIMVLVMKMLVGMNPGDIMVGVVAMQTFVLLCLEMGLANRIAGTVDNGSSFIRMSLALGIMVLVIKMISGMDPGDILIGVAALQAFMIIIAELAFINRKAGEVGNSGGAVLKLAGSILILTGLAWLLSKMTTSDILKGFSVMQLFILVILELVGISKLIDKEVADISKNLIAMSMAIAVLAATATLLGFIPIPNLIKGVAAVGVLGLVMAAMIKASEGATDVKNNLVVMVVAIGVMAAAIVALSFVDGKDLAGATAAIGSLMLCFALMTHVTSKMKDTKAMRKTLALMIGIVIVLAGLISAMSYLPNPNNAVASAIALGILLAAFTTSLRILGTGGRVSKSVSAQINSMIGVAAGLAILLVGMSRLSDPSALIHSAIALGILLNTFSSSMRILGTGGSISKSVAAQLDVMIGVAAGLTILLIGISRLSDPSALVSSAIALSILLNAFSASMRILGTGGSISKSVAIQINSMVGVAAGLAILLVGMSRLSDPSALVPSAIALGILLNAFTASLRILGTGGSVSKTVAAQLVPLTIVAAGLGILLAIMSQMVNPDSIIPTAIGLSTALLAMSAACVIASLVPAAAAIEGALGLAAFIGIMAGVIAAFGLLTLIPGFTDIMSNGVEVFTLIGEAIGGFVGGIIGGIGSGAAPGIVKLGEALGTFGAKVQPFLDAVSSCEAGTVIKAGLLTEIIGALTGTAFLEGIGTIFGLGLPGLGEDLAKFGGHVGNFSRYLNGVDSEAVTAAKNVADMLLTLTTNDFLSDMSWLFGGIDYDTMGKNLKSFGETVVEFSNTISGKVDADAVKAAADAGALLVTLQESLPKSGGLIQDIFGEHDFGAFATACSDFADAILTINDKLSQDGFELESDKIEDLVEAGTRFSDLANAIPKSDGFVQDWVGKQDLTTFGNAVGNFSDTLLRINEALSAENLVIHSDKLEDITKAGENFSDLANVIPKSDGFVQTWVGKQDLTTFGTAVENFANCVLRINETLNQDGFAVDLDGIEDLKNAGFKMNELQNALPKSGGWWQDVTGSEDIGKFGDSIKTFAESIVNFSISSAALNMPAIDSALSTSYRIKDLIQSLIGLDTSGVAKFTGVGTGWVGADGPAYDIAEAMIAFSNKIVDLDTTRVSIAVTYADKLKTLINDLVGIDSSGIKQFDVEAIGNKMRSYSYKVRNMDMARVEASITACKKLLNFIHSTVGLDDEGVTTFTSAVEELSTVGVTDVVRSFSNASEKMSKAGINMIEGLIDGIKSKLPAVSIAINTALTKMVGTMVVSALMFKIAGEAIATNIAAGISDKKNTVTEAMNFCLSGLVTTINGKYQSLYNAGAYLVSGFANGISDNSYKATEKAKNMAKSVEKIVRQALLINSPSKVFTEIGSGIPEGFAMGIGMLGGVVSQSVSDMSSNAVNSARTAMSTVLDALNSDMDAQPTIRPVIDLTDVKTGAHAISSMFGGTPSIGVRSNLNAISYAMNNKLQNGTNNDIISAINKLNDGLGANRGDTYNFAGITYDDGSNIHEAVTTLVRASKMGRRV